MNNRLFTLIIQPLNLILYWSKFILTHALSQSVQLKYTSICLLCIFLCRSTDKSDGVSKKRLSTGKKCLNLTRIVACISVFILVFSTSVVSKLTFILMVTNVLQSNEGLKNPNKTLQYFKATTFTYVDITWIWSLLLALIAPYVFTVIKYIWILLCNKKWKTEKGNEG